jgi:hypothetical protein
MPAHPGQFGLALQLDVAVAVADDVLEVTDVGPTVETRQLQALEILDGSPEHAEANAGSPVGVGSGA